jgi:hypothetical protein
VLCGGYADRWRTKVTEKLNHNYDNEKLPALIERAMGRYDMLVEALQEIQTLTGIPGLHTDINSDDPSPGGLERIQSMYDDQADYSLEVFKSFDAEDAW